MMLDDPRLNFAISARGRQAGLDHLGIQVEEQSELKEVYARLQRAGGNVIEQGQTNCCYAKSEKIVDRRPGRNCPGDILTTGESTDYSDGSGEREARIAGTTACCEPTSAAMTANSDAATCCAMQS